MTKTASPSIGDIVEDMADLALCMAFYGPAVAFVVAPWLLLGLVLIGPFAILLLLVVALLAATALVAALGAVLMVPLRMLRSRRGATTPKVRPAVSLQRAPRPVIAAARPILYQ